MCINNDDQTSVNIDIKELKYFISFLTINIIYFSFYKYDFVQYLIS